MNGRKAWEAQQQRTAKGRRRGTRAAALPRRFLAAGHQEPLRRTTLELVAELTSMAFSASLRRSGARRWPIDVDLAALLATLEGVPRLRAWLDELLTPGGAELLLELSRASLHTVLRSELGPVAALLRHGLALREAHAQRSVWAERGRELEPDPSAAPAEVPPRPAPLRAGIIERYEQHAVPAALSTFGAEAVLTLDLEAASSALIGGLPRAARVGRWAFVSHLVWELAARQVIVVDRAALEKLDRIDCILFVAELADEKDAGRGRLVEVARRSGLELRVLGERPERPRRARTGEHLPSKESPLEAVRRLQRDGRGVLFIHRGASDAYRAADCSLALGAEGPPRGAHLVAARGWDDAALLVEAIEGARACALQSTQLAVAGVATALSLLFGGLDRLTTRRITVAASVTSLFAMGNAVRLVHGLRRAPLRPLERKIAWHDLSPDESLERLDVTAERGISEERARRRRPSHPEPPSDHRLLLGKIGREISNPMTPILAGGAALSAMVGSVVDAGLIGGALGLNAGLGGIQGYRTERAVLTLAQQEERPTRVLRDGRERKIADRDLVEGDIVLLEAGDVVPADCRILSGTSAEVDESSLTGESQPVRKQVEPTPGAPMAERTCMLYEGSSINVGSLKALVVATGDRTEGGRARSASREGQAPPGVEARLRYLSSFTAPVAGLSALAMTASGLMHRRPLQQVVTSAVGLGVAAVPEGLPILATIAQLAAAERLSAYGALVRNPRALEALGRMDVLCADKTGTLTEGRIFLRVVSDGQRHLPLDQLSEEHRDIVRVALQASPRPFGSPLPHPTDQALVEGARQHDILRDESLERHAELPFEPARGLHASVEDNGARGALKLSVKGAPETVLPRATHMREGQALRRLEQAERERWLAHADQLAAQGYRVLAVAEREVDGDFVLDDGSVEELVLLGFLGYADPVRASAREALAELVRAGVRVIMITGDHPGTAESIAQELGLLNGHRVITGAELDELDDAELAECIDEFAVFARVAPLQKVRIVRTLGAAGHVIGMTGDGANDAPAIQLADVGIALGEGSTPAARGAADLIVSDGRIETILRSVLEGRALWTRVRDAVSILVGGNLGEIAFSVAGGMSDGRSPLNARQLLLVNLLTDTLPALAIAVRPPIAESAEELMSAGPEASLGRELERDMMVRGLVTASAAGLAMALSRRSGAAREEASTVGLLTLTGAQLGQTFVSGGRSGQVIAASLGSLAVLLAAVQTPRVSQFFGCRPLGARGLVRATGVTLLATGAARIASETVLGQSIEGQSIEERRAPETPWSRALRRATASARRRIPDQLALMHTVEDFVRLSRRVAVQMHAWSGR